MCHFALIVRGTANCRPVDGCRFGRVSISSGAIMLTHILSTLYVVAGIVGNVAYVPTIRDLWLLKPAANLQSYIL